MAIAVKCGGASSMHTCLIGHICHLFSHQLCTAKVSDSGKIFFQLLTCLEYFDIRWSFRGIYEILYAILPKLLFFPLIICLLEFLLQISKSQTSQHQTFWLILQTSKYTSKLFYFCQAVVYACTASSCLPLSCMLNNSLPCLLCLNACSPMAEAHCWRRPVCLHVCTSCCIGTRDFFTWPFFFVDC